MYKGTMYNVQRDNVQFTIRRSRKIYNLKYKIRR